jgi:putative ABC transport system permease protein
MNLPLANILHHKLRSLLSAAGIGMGICMLVTLSGLSRGSLYEIAERWESVDADLIVFPAGWGDSATARSGVGLSEKLADYFAREHDDLVARAVPVFTWPMKLAGQDQMAAGIRADAWSTVTGDATLREGRLFDPDGSFDTFLEQRLLQTTDQPADELTAETLAERGGLEIVIDDRLAKAGRYTLGQTVRSANHDWTIVGIAPAGVMTRVFLPLPTAQYLFGSGDITKCTLIFLKLREGVPVGSAAKTLRDDIGQDVIPLAAYRGMLEQKFGVMFHYVDAVNVIALVIAFLFVMTVLYMMVLQRTREIAILKSCGASRGYILRQVLGESLILTALGTAMGIALSLLAAWGIERVAPLLTVQITLQWLGIAILAAAVGACGAALYPAWRATRVDMAEVLTYE